MARLSPLLGVLALLAGPARGEGPAVRFVLPSRVLVGDPAADPRFEPQALAARFRERFSAAFPGAVVELGAERMLSADERVLLAMPAVTAVRTAHEVKAGSIHDFTAIVAGAVWVVDPWTNAVLQAGTRMAEGTLRLGESQLGSLDAELRKAFAEAGARWLEACLDQLRTGLEPFLVEAATVEMPKGGRKRGGGVWPRGTAHGVREGLVFAAGAGRYARVTASFRRFSLLRDAADPARLVPPGESYSAVVVDRPSERPEPAVAVTWVGRGPSTPGGEGTGEVPTAGLLSFLRSYLGKGGGFRVLPATSGASSSDPTLAALSGEVSRFTNLVASGGITLHRESLLEAARESPDVRVEVGCLETYRGTRETGGGRKERLYRATFAATVSARQGEGESAVYPLGRLVLHPEELALAEMAGVREVSPGDAWFTVCRNGMVRLGSSLREEVSRLLAASGSRREARVVRGRVDWGGPPPGRHTPLALLRPAGEVRAADGKESLGTLLLEVPPSAGYLTPSNLPSEPLAEGDVVAFRGEGSSRPTAALTLEVEAASRRAWVPEPAWLLRLAADALGQGGAASLVPVDASAPSPAGLERSLRVAVSALGMSPAARGAAFTGQWRGRVLASGGGEGAPLAKFGLQLDSTGGPPPGREPLAPPDVTGWGLRYVTDALRALGEKGLEKGLRESLADGPAEAR
ncbi:MAG: hypothetical protein EDX89_20965 [Acidobacteria bacterium]|nr:MAG: hypothetical protein EDX89_20965 [Acidobacteriota bacterium]